MRLPDLLLNGSAILRNKLANFALAGLLATGCSLPQYSSETNCARNTLIADKTPELTLKLKKRLTARVYDVSPDRNARILVALEPGALLSKEGPKDLGISDSTEDIDVTLLIDASSLPPAIGIRYSFPGTNGDRMFATLATEAAGYNYRQCNLVDVKIVKDMPELTVNGVKKIVPALPM